MNFILENEDFDVKKIFESGQNFSYDIEKDFYCIKVNDTLVKIKTIGNHTYFNIDEEFFNKYLFDYFDMGTDYEQIRNDMSEKFPELKEYIDFGKGLRFLNQDFLEVSTSFIISQNNNIKRIKKSIESLISLYGDNGYFPTLDKLKSLSQEDFKNLGVGFRDQYLYEFYKSITPDKINDLKRMKTEEAYNELLKFKGIGPKVANCILLFGLEKRDVFPVDTHIKQIMEKIYFEEKDILPKEIEKYAKDKFGEYSSYVQQYLFYWKINNKI